MIRQFCNVYGRDVYFNKQANRVFLLVQIIEVAQLFGETFVKAVYGFFKFFPVVVGESFFSCWICLYIFDSGSAVSDCLRLTNSISACLFVQRGSSICSSNWTLSVLFVKSASCSSCSSSSILSSFSFMYRALFLYCSSFNWPSFLNWILSSCFFRLQR